MALTARFFWIVGLVGSVAGALAGEQLPEPYNHYVMLIGTIAAAVTGYKIQYPPPRVWTENERLQFQATGAAPPSAPPRPPTTSTSPSASR